MIKLLEAIFRRFLLLLVMLLVPTAIGIGVAYVLPPSYQASATLLALKRYDIIGATGPESDLQATPAETQVATLTGLLQSRTFDVAVATPTNLKSTLNLTPQQLSNRQILEDAYAGDISKNVQVTTKSTNVYEVTYTNGNPRIALQVISSVITVFQTKGRTISIQEGQHLLQATQGQLAQAQKAVDAATKKENTYAVSHPDSTTSNDPEYAQLDENRVAANATLQNIQAAVTTLNQEIADESAGDYTFFQVLDTPVLPAASARSKVLLTTGGAGVAIGLLVCILYILIIVRRDRAFYSPLDVQTATSYPILMQVPRIPNASKELVISGISR